jgi:glutaredoxin 2
VYLYEHPNYQGRCLKFNDDAPDLRSLNFDDAASSIRIVGDWAATLYADLNGTGTAASFTRDDPNVADDPIGDNRATSIRVRRDSAASAVNTCDGAEGVYLYEHPNYQGRCIKLTADLLDMRVLSFDDTASSLRIVGAWTVTLYRDLSGTGVSNSFTRDDPNLAGDPIGDNQATSVRVQRGNLPGANICDGGDGVYLYEHSNYQGRCIKLIADAPDLRSLNFDDSTSSIGIVGNWSATLYRDLNGTGIASTFTRSDPNIVDFPIGDNQATSVRLRRG